MLSDGLGITHRSKGEKRRARSWSVMSEEMAGPPRTLLGTERTLLVSIPLPKSTLALCGLAEAIARLRGPLCLSPPAT